MKRTLILILVVAMGLPLAAKKVRFAVDLTGNEISPNGVHIAGDFQAAAGFAGGDWVSNSTRLTKEGNTEIYSRVVDIPAFRKYEYRFINGDQFYESEFIPVESRVGYDFNDNRWIYVDSLANDTTYVGAIVFGGNAPAGKMLVRFFVNVQAEPSVAATGVHVAGSFQGWNPATIRLYSFVDKVFEIICYVGPGTYDYKFYNGNTTASAEVVPATCATNGNRRVQVSDHIELSTVCFRRCADCTALAVEKLDQGNGLKLFPNPVENELQISIPSACFGSISVYDLVGKEHLSASAGEKKVISLNVHHLPKGIYLVRVQKESGASVARFVKN